MAEGGLAAALKPGNEGLSLQKAGNLVRDFQHELPSGSFRGSYGALPTFSAPPSSNRSYLGEFGDSFLHTVSEQNPTMFGQALETMGILMESDSLFNWGVDLQEFAVRNSMGQPGSVPSWSNVVDAEGAGDFLDKTARYVAAGLGTALGSMAPQVATGLAGAAAGAVAAGPLGAAPGAVAGSLMPSVAMNMGEAYGTFVEEGVDRFRAAEWAAAITPFTAGLDALGFTKLITKGADTSGPLLRYIGRRIAQGYLSEATTEGAQAAIKEATAAHLTDNPDLAGRATKVLDEFLIGGMGGAAIAGPAAVMRGRQPPAVPPGEPVEGTDFGDLPPETPEMGPEAPAAAPVEPMAEPAPAAETFTVELPDTIVKRDGKPYPSLKAVEAAKRNRKLTDHEPVEVEGGWALQRPGTAQETLAEAQETLAGVQEPPQPEVTPDAEQADSVQEQRPDQPPVQAPESETGRESEAAPEEEAEPGAAEAVQDDTVEVADEPAARAPEAPPEPAAEPAQEREPEVDAPLEPEPADAPVVEDVEPASEPPAAIRKMDGEPYPSLKAAEAAKRGPRIARMGGVREDYEAVRVEGGYELRRVDAETEVEEDVETEAEEVEAGVSGVDPAPEPAAEGEGARSAAAPSPSPADEPGLIRKADGTPYKSRNAAAFAARMKKMDAEPVEVDGGWALQTSGAPPPAAPPAPERPADTRPRPGIEEIGPTTLETDAQAFQYKEGGDMAGVTERLQGVKQWDQLKSGVAYVWERADGKRFIADGHQRVGLAKRLADQDPRLDVRIFKETDGYSQADMRELSAVKNIAEGTGTAWDAATILRETDDPAVMDTLPPNSAIVRDARGLAKLDEELFAAAKASPGANPGHWAVIGEVGDGDRALQDLLVQSFKARPPKSRREAELQARLIQADRIESEAQENLFGTEDVAQSLYAEKARIMDAAIRRLSQDRRVFQTLDQHAGTIEAAGNRLAAGNSEIAQEAGRAAALIQRLGTLRGPVADELNAAARELHDGGSQNAAVNRFIEAVKAWSPTAQREAGGGTEGGGRTAPESQEETDQEPTAEELEAAGQGTIRLSQQFDLPQTVPMSPEELQKAKEKNLERDIERIRQMMGSYIADRVKPQKLRSNKRQKPADFGLFRTDNRQEALGLEESDGDQGTLFQKEPQLRLAAVQMGRRVLENGDTGYTTWSDTLAAAMDKLVPGLGDQIAPYASMVYEALRVDPANDFVADMTPADGTPQAPATAPSPRDVSSRSIDEAPATPTPGLPVGIVRGIVAPISARWNDSAPGVEVVANVAVLPDNVRQTVASMTGDSQAAVRGLLHTPRNGSPPTVYLVAENLHSPGEVRRVLSHEVIGHYSMQDMLGESFPRFLADVGGLSNAGDRRINRYVDIVRENYGDLPPDLMAEEVIAHMAEDGVKHPLMVRAIATVRRFLRGMGFRLSFTYPEVQDMIARAGRRVRGERSWVAQNRGQEEALRATRTPDRQPEPLTVEGPEQRGQKEFLDTLRLASAWHGSPHRFDQFTIDAIGTGEGAQVYGWGLYFTETKEIADWYRKHQVEDRKTLTLKGETVDRFSPEFRWLQDLLHEHDIGKRTGSGVFTDYRDYIVELVRRGAAQMERMGDSLGAETERRLIPMLESLQEDDVKLVKPKGATYKVELAPKPDEYLLWDRPLSQQSDKVKAAFDSMEEKLAPWFPNDRASGREAYKEVANILGSDRSASESLLAAGVRGIKYLDGNARGRAQGATFNYVIFDDSDIMLEEVRLSQQKVAASEARAKDRRLSRPIDKLFRIPFAVVGGLDARGNWKWSKPVLDRAKRVVQEMQPDPTGSFRWLGPVIDKARHGLIDRYGTPEEFVTRERYAHTERHLMMAEMSAHLQSFADAELTNDDYVALQEVLEGKELNDERLSKLAEPVRQALDEMGQSLVDLGLLTEESYQKNLGTYLHRSYRKYEADAPALVRWKRNVDKRRRQSLHGDELMRRGRSHKINGGPKRLLRDVPEAMQAEAETATEWEVWDRKDPSGKVTKRIYWPAGMAREDGIFGPGAWDSQGVWKREDSKGGSLVLHRDWTKAEREQMGEIRDARYNIVKSYELMAHDISQGRMFQDISQNPQWFTKAPPETAVVVEGADARYLDTFAGVEWVKVPDTLIPKSNTKRWGALAGGYLRASIYRDMMELQKMQRPTLWTEALSWWKKFKTVHSPVVHFNNVMSNVFLADMIDIGFGDMARAIQEVASEGQYYQEAHAHGVFNNGFAIMELDRTQRTKMMREIIDQVEEENYGSSTQRMMALFKAIDERMTTAYRFEDEIFRLASYVKDRHRGDAPETAAKRAVDAFLNYDIRAPWINAMRRTVLPFFSYTYRIVPQMVQNTVQRPWKLAKYFTMGYAIQALSYELVEGDEEEERRAMADRDKGWTWTMLPKMLRLPFEGAHGDPYYINLTRIMPGGGLLDTDKGQLPLPEWMLVSGPLAIASDLLSNRVAFTGEDIVNREIDTAGEAWGKRFTYLARSVLPNAPWIPGSWSVGTIMRALGDETDFRGRQYSELEAALRSFGPKVSTFDIDSQRLLRNFEFNRQERAYQERLYKLRMDYGRGRMSEANFRKAVEQVFDGLRRVQEKRAAVFGGADG